MALFLGKISSNRKKAPRRISNALPKNIVYKNGSYFRLDSKGNEQRIEFKKAEESFGDLFNLKKTQKQTIESYVDEDDL